MLTFYSNSLFIASRYYSQNTGGQGFHLVYRASDRIKPVKGEVKGKLGRGVDIKGAGGLIVAAGSVHLTGRLYTVKSNVLIAPAPEWIEDELTRPATQAPKVVVDFQERRERSQGAKFFADGERNDGLRDLAAGWWLHGHVENESELYQRLLDARTTRCAPGSDLPATDEQLWDLTRRTARKYARASLQGVA